MDIQIGVYCVNCTKLSKFTKIVLTSNIAEEVPPLYAAAREGVGSAGAEAEDELRPCDNDNDYDDNDNDNEDNDKMIMIR